MRKLKHLLALLLVIGVAGPSLAFAAPYDWTITSRNSDDTDYVVGGAPSLPTGTYGVMGTRLGGEGGASWYVLNYPGSPFTLSNGGGTYGANNYKIGFEPGAINPLDLGNLGDLLDAKASNTALSALSATVSALQASTTGMAVQIQSDWSQASTTAKDFVKNKPSIDKAYEGTTLRTGAYPIFKNATVGSGVAVFHLTADGTSGGSSICPTGIIQDSIDVEVNDATASYQMSYALSNGNKTVTVTANKLTTANILTGILGQSAANTSVVRLVAWCY